MILSGLLPPPIVLADTACFFDVDGTLASIETRPEYVTIPLDIKQALCDISSAAGGALALVSGRPISELDSLSAPLRGPAAGVHGAERSGVRGECYRVVLPSHITTTLSQECKTTIAAFTGCHVEEKGVALALHYRQGEKYRDQILVLAQNLVRRYPELVLQTGKCVIELKPAGIDKGAAIAAFMQEAPFWGRIPLFIGDDLTDEAGFKQVNALHGITIKVGPGTTVARYHLNNVEQVHRWILTLVQQQK